MTFFYDNFITKKEIIDSIKEGRFKSISGSKERDTARLRYAFIAKRDYNYFI